MRTDWCGRMGPGCLPAAPTTYCSWKGLKRNEGRNGAANIACADAGDGALLGRVQGGRVAPAALPVVQGGLFSAAAFLSALRGARCGGVHCEREGEALFL